MAQAEIQGQPHATASAEILQATAARYLDLFKSLDADAYNDIITPDYEHDFAPESLNFPKQQGKTDFIDRVRSLRSVADSFPVTIKQIWPNPSLGQVVVWAHAVPHFHDYITKAIDEEEGKQEWSCRNEYMFVITMDVTGHKVRKTIEFLDNKQTEAITALAIKARKKQCELEGKKQ